MTWAQLRGRSGDLLPELAQQLADGTWCPGDLRQIAIPTYTGKTMLTSVPPVLDRLVHRAIRNAVEPVLEARAFYNWVSGFRPRRNRLTSLRQAAAFRDAGYSWVADIDVKEVSDRAHVDEAVDWFAKHIHDGTMLARIRTCLNGMPGPIAPGSGLAPLLINLRLSQVDIKVNHMRIVRFADNYCAFARTKFDAEEAFYALSDALGALRLCPNEEKSRIRSEVNIEDLFLIGG